MSNDHSDGHGNSSNGSNRDDILNGSARNDRINGHNGDDQIFGNGGNDVLKGGKGDDVLSGGAGNDILFGNSGKDILLGGAGNDILYGDDKGHGHFSFWWLCKPPGYADYLDGGSGNDKVYGSSGNDFANYTMAENLGAHDLYDGGKGTDTLQLKLTYGEFALTSVQQDISRFELFLDRHGNPGKDNGPVFQFASFDLDASDFETLKIALVNTGPTANNDAGATNEDTVRTVAKATGLLANDTDPDHLDVLHVSAFAAVSALGAAVNVNADGSYSYDPTAAAALQALAQGATATDTFTYTIADLAGATSTATVNIKVTGINDAPVARNDAYSVSEDSTLTVAGTGVLGNDSDIDSAALTALLLSAPAHGTLTLSANGSFIYTPGADFNGSDSFSYRAHDGIAGSGPALVSINVTAVNDAPTAVNDSATVDEDSVAVIAVLANDNIGPANESAQTLTLLAAQAQHGNVAINADGTLGYTPNADYFGSDTITYTIQDNGTTNGAADPKTATGQVDVTVREANDAPTAADDAATLDEDGVAIIAVLDNDNAGPNETSQTLTVIDAAALHGAVTINADGTLSYAPTANYNGADTISYTIRDNGTSGGAADPKTASATVAVTINPVNDAPVGASYNTGTNEDTPILFGALIFDTDVDGDTLAVTSAGAFTTTLGAAVVLNADGRFSYDPTVSSTLQALNNGETAQDGFFYTVGDGHGGTGTAHVGVLVSGVTDAAASSGKIIPSVPPGADLDYFVRIEGGDWLELQSFSTGFANSGIVLGGGGGAGKAQPSDLVLELGSSAALIGLTEALATGEHLKNVEIESYRSSFEGRTLVDEFKFTDLLVNKLDSGNGVSNLLSFDFRTFTQGHVEQNDKGGIADTSGTGWNFALNQEIPAPVPHADAAKAPLADQVPADAQGLKYFIHFDGADGWLELDSFSLGLQNTGSIGGSGGGTGKSSADAVQLLLGSSLEIPQLTGMINSGEHLKNVEIETYAATGSKLGASLVDEFKFNDVNITKIDSSNGTTNNLSFEFSSFTHGHVEHNDQGGIADTSGFGWSFKLNEEISAPTPLADAGKAIPEGSVPPGADLDYFVRIEGGDWLELQSFSTGFANSGIVLGGGGGAGKAQPSDLVLELGSSAALIGLTEALATGEHLKNVEIESYRSSFEGRTLVDEFKFTDLLVNKLDSANGVSNLLSFDFRTFTQGHVEQNDKGGIGDTSGTGWNFALNQEIPAPVPHADAAKAPLADQVPADAQGLKYFIHFDGADGWLELDSFSLGLQNTGSIGGSGGGTGKSSADAVQLLLGSSLEIPQLTGMINSGEHLKNVEIETYAATGSKLGASLVDEFKFNDVNITKIDSSNGTTNNLSFEFSSFTHGHVEHNDQGGIADTSGFGWSFKLNEEISAPTPLADAGKAIPEGSVPPGADLDYFVRIEGGDWLELQSFSTGFANSGIVLGGGGGAGKAQPSDLVLELGSSAVLIGLTEALATGEHLKNVEIESYRSSFEGRTLVDEFKFTDLLVNKLDSGNGVSNLLSFDFRTFTQGHVEQNDKGGIADTSGTGWNFALNQEIPAPVPHADAAKAPLADQVPADAQGLKYFIHFDGADGWLELDSFSLGLQNTGSIGGSGGGTGKSSADAVQLLLGSSLEIPQLTGMINSGEHLKNVEIETYAATGSKLGASLVDEFKFNDVNITKIDSSNGTTNNLSFEFSSFTHGHVEHNDQGGIADTSGFGWSFKLNQEINAPTPHADVDLFA